MMRAGGVRVPRNDAGGGARVPGDGACGGAPVFPAMMRGGGHPRSRRWCGRGASVFPAMMRAGAPAFPYSTKSSTNSQALLAGVLQGVVSGAGAGSAASVVEVPFGIRLFNLMYIKLDTLF